LSVIDALDTWMGLVSLPMLLIWTFGQILHFGLQLEPYRWQRWAHTRLVPWLVGQGRAGGAGGSG
jgi:hypothetical protein